MNHTPQIKKAIQFAARKHHGQMRLETEPLPYVTHLFSTALLVAEDGADDDVVSAALLHDTLEDTETTREELVAAFSERVAALVEGVSEIKEADGKRIPWRDRKVQYLERIRSGPDDALLISMADKIDNIESMLEEIGKNGDGIFEKFGHTAEEYLWYHGELARIAEKRLPTHRLAKRLAEAYARERAMLAER
ncbi:MAG TPA: HD domain-containing protein [Candidatus Paceibacterota bacterium]|nr:HD domain-containing protein [Candidatus Paceibacterota bacterium]